MPTKHPLSDDAPVPALPRADADRESPAAAAAADAAGEHTVPAGRLPDWEIGTLEPPPQFSWERLDA